MLGQRSGPAASVLLFTSKPLPHSHSNHKIKTIDTRPSALPPLCIAKKKRTEVTPLLSYLISKNFPKFQPSLPPQHHLSDLADKAMPSPSKPHPNSPKRSPRIRRFPVGLYNAIPEKQSATTPEEERPLPLCKDSHASAGDRGFAQESVLERDERNVMEADLTQGFGSGSVGSGQESMLEESPVPDKETAARARGESGAGETVRYFAVKPMPEAT